MMDSLNIVSKAHGSISSGIKSGGAHGVHEVHEGSFMFFFVIILILILVAFVIFIHKNNKFKQQMRFWYFKLLIKMNKLEKIKENLSRLLKNGRVDDVIQLFDSIKESPEFSSFGPDDKVECEKIYNKAINKKKEEIIECCINDIKLFLEEKNWSDAEKSVSGIESEISLYVGEKSKEFQVTIDNLKKEIKKQEIATITSEIHKLVDKGEIKEALSLFDVKTRRYSIVDLSETDSFLRKKVDDLICSLLNSEKTEDAVAIIQSLKLVEQYKSLSFVDDYNQLVQKKIAGKIEGFIKSLKLIDADNLLSKNQDFLPAKIIAEFRKRINDENINKFAKIIESFDNAIANGLVEEAETCIAKASSCKYVDKSILDGKKHILEDLKKRLEAEKSFEKEIPLLIMPWFNEPKKKDAGEDADPLCIVRKDRTWGVLGVFDGMGGAGARKYVHKDTGEEHTAAYWASRIVKSSVEVLLNERPVGKDPVEYIEENLHNTIVEKLNDAIVNFPSASTTMSKMIRKLPTTLALCAFKVDEDFVDIRCYWAGDSRVYLLNKNGVTLLTIDDADAPDGDPFSPANMDLAMNNTVCQDREFRINKSLLKLKLEKDNPFVLIPCTDGCFGYYKNPIEFESMLRSQLLNSNDEDNWSDKIKKAIIDNIQQDDFSMSIISLGVNSFAELKDCLSHIKGNILFDSYFEWRDGIINGIASLQSQIEECNEKMFEIRGKKEKLIETSKQYDEDLDLFIRKWKEQEEIAKRYDVNFGSIEGSNAYMAIKKKIDNKNNSITLLDDEFEKIHNNWSMLKERLEKMQLESDRRNNEWYEKYKLTISIVKPSGTI